MLGATTSDEVWGTNSSTRRVWTDSWGGLRRGGRGRGRGKEGRGRREEGGGGGGGGGLTWPIVLGHSLVEKSL